MAGRTQRLVARAVPVPAFHSNRPLGRLWPLHAGSLPFVRHGYVCVGDAYAALLRAHVVRGCKATRPVALTAVVVPTLRARVARAAVQRCAAESVVQRLSGSAAEREGVGYSAPSVVRVVLGNSVYFVVQERGRGQDRIVCRPRPIESRRALELGARLSPLSESSRARAYVVVRER